MKNQLRRLIILSDNIEKKGKVFSVKRLGYLIITLVLAILFTFFVVPKFKTLIITAKYAHPTSMVSALRTKIKVFYLENSYLPGLAPQYIRDVTDGTITGSAAIGGASWGLYTNSTSITDLDISSNNALMSDLAVQFHADNAKDNKWLLSVDASTKRDYVDDMCPGFSPLQRDLKVDYGNYGGGHWDSSDNMYIAVDCGYQDESYAYVVGVSSDKIRQGTGYAVMDIYNTNWTTNLKTIGVFKRFRSLRHATGEMFLKPINKEITEEDINPNSIYVPNWYFINTELTMTDKDGNKCFDKKKFENMPALKIGK